MASNRGRNRADEFSALMDRAPKDVDPEAEVEADGTVDDSRASENEPDGDIHEHDGREHYTSVGMGRLQNTKTIPLGTRYRGSRIGRADAMQTESDGDDPFARDSGEQTDGDDRVMSDVSGSKDRSLEISTEDSDEEISGTDTGDEGHGILPHNLSRRQDDRTELRKVLAQERKAVATSISHASKVDAEKGRAVKRQRTAFDSLLNTRIKLQKALIGANTLVGISDLPAAEERLAVEAAEIAAFKLWSSLDHCRATLLKTKPFEQLESPHLTVAAATDKLWKHVQLQETESSSSRTTVLQKWSSKARGVASLSRQNRLNNEEQLSTVIDVIQGHLSNSHHLMKRANTPRSCAPFQLESKMNEDEHIYDDADFYALMLKELLDRNSRDSVVAADMNVGFRLRREAKTKKNVDTKASKGRKLRYTVHEKLQSFMAPEDRRTWGASQTDELFRSLFGQRFVLGEGNGEEAFEETDDEMESQEAAMFLFRTT